MYYIVLWFSLFNRHFFQKLENLKINILVILCILRPKKCTIPHFYFEITIVWPYEVEFCCEDKVFLKGSGWPVPRPEFLTKKNLTLIFDLQAHIMPQLNVFWKFISSATNKKKDFFFNILGILQLVDHCVLKIPCLEQIVFEIHFKTSVQAIFIHPLTETL